MNIYTNKDSDTLMTLGSLLVDWLPDLFRRTTDNTTSATSRSKDDDDNCGGNRTVGSDIVEPISETYQWIVAGISRPPLTIAVLDLWRNLCHPDHFLNIIVLST